MCVTDENNFIFVFQFYNKTGCPLQKKKKIMLQPLWISASFEVTYISGIRIIYNNTSAVKLIFQVWEGTQNGGICICFILYYTLNWSAPSHLPENRMPETKWIAFEKNINLWMLCDSFFITVSFRMYPLQLYSHVIQNSSVWIFVCLLRIKWSCSAWDSY